MVDRVRVARKICAVIAELLPVEHVQAAVRASCRLKKKQRTLRTAKIVDWASGQGISFKWFECRPLPKHHSCLKTLHWQHFNSYKTGSGIPRCEPDAAGREAQSLFYAASPVKWLKANFLQSKFTRLFIIQPGPGARLKPQAVRMGQSNKFCKGQNVPKQLTSFRFMWTMANAFNSPS